MLELTSGCMRPVAVFVAATFAFKKLSLIGLGTGPPRLPSGPAQGL